MRIERIIKRAAALGLAIILSAASIIPAYAEDAPAATDGKQEGQAILIAGTSKKDGVSNGLSAKIAAAAGGAENVEAIVWNDTYMNKESNGAIAVNTTSSITTSDGKTISPSDKYVHVWAWYDKDGSYTGAGTSGMAKTVYLYSNLRTVYVHSNSSGMFFDYLAGKNFSNLKKINLSTKELDWSYVTNMTSAFYGCSKLEEFDFTALNNFNYENVTMSRMFAKSGIKKITVPAGFTFATSTGIDGYWKKDGTTYTSYKLETSILSAGTYEKDTSLTKYDDGSDDHETSTYQADIVRNDSEVNNFWEIHNIGDKKVAFCIDGYDDNISDEELNEVRYDVSTKYPGATPTQGYYVRETYDKSKEKYHIDGTKVASDAYYNSEYFFGSSKVDKSQAEEYEKEAAAPGETLEEILTALLYWGPQVYGTKNETTGEYSITTVAQYKLLQNDIWHFTNHYGKEAWKNGASDTYKAKWAGKTYDSIPKNEKTTLYVYTSLNGCQNIISVGVVVPPEISKTKVTISKTDITGTQEIDNATLTITDKDGKTVVEPWNTKAGENKEVSLVPGTYTLTETTAPDGFAKTESITFTVKEDGTVTGTSVSTDNESGSSKVTMKDAYNKVKIWFYKLDEDGNKLGGAKIKLTLVSTIAGVENNAEYIKYCEENKTPFSKTIEFEPDGTDGAELTLYPGTYTVSETAAPKGYEKAESFTFKVDDNGNVTCFSTNDKNEKTGFYKFGASVILGESGNVTTFNKGEITKYDSEEAAAKADKAKYDEKNLDAIYMVDEQKTKTVKISKVDIAGKEIDGATLYITDKDNNIVKGKDGNELKWKSEEGKTHSVELKPGTYTLYEETAPDGYVKAESITFTVDSDGKVSYDGKDKQTTKDNATVPDDTVQMKDEYQKYVVTFVKNAEGDNGSYERLAGAKLSVKNKTDGSVVKTWESTADADYQITLSPGTYIFHEVSAPKYYSVADDIEFRVAIGGKVYTVADGKETEVKDQTVTVNGSSEKVKQIEMTDEKTVVKVSKVKESDGTSYLSGAKLQIKDSDGKIIEEWTSTSKPYTIKGKLIAGVKYTLHEASAPKGYEVAADIEFTCTGKDQTITMQDVATGTTPGKVIVKKVDSTSTSTYVSGAKLQIKDEDGKVVEEWTTNSNSHTVSVTLTVGKKYTLHEESAPSGYKTASDITFTASSSDQTITMKDTPTKSDTTTEKTKYTITIKKVDEDGDAVSGAKMQIKDSSGNVYEEWTTTSSAHTVSATLTKNKSYIVHEESAPSGYETASDKTFVYSKDTTITIVDKKKPSTSKTTTTTTTTNNDTTTTTTTNSTAKTQQTAKTARDNPTGDTANMAVWIGFIVVAAGTLAFVITRRNRKTK